MENSRTIGALSVPSLPLPLRSGELMTWMAQDLAGFKMGVSNQMSGPPNPAGFPTKLAIWPYLFACTCIISCMDACMHR